MSTLAERMQFVLDQEPKWVKNARAWSLAAGLSDKHVTTYLDRAASDPTRDMQRAHVVALAHAARVSVGWFVAGEGSPRGAVDSRSPIDEFVRARLRELRRKGATLGTIADQLRLEVRVVRLVWGGQPVPEKHLESIARALGFTSVEALRGAAAEWWRTRGEELLAALDPRSDSDPARAEANSIARSYGANDQTILATLETTNGTADMAVWLERFMADHARDQLTSEANDRRVAAPARKATRNEIAAKQAAFREAHAAKKAPRKKTRTDKTGTHD